ncbi:TetR/AcrR family transcriptional regulator C-terminal domain-containing protein [Paenibacillus glycanilyticus]|uniref:TetR/AcrR family transcriptional regulator n=1 Tax=Paenibacillus glycanilyticus TaxID=126569 RepID=UPI00203B9467|nr:TetR/AcrR family transcriptional regulator C-terminal domain-containing protein [Paenibacillus glycanilyticus]MCM3626634.1 TetR/AcrR family transcriptional regulator C-terminal domain-containing protein [Paenibacillus glycanilyticus]
MDKTTTKTDPRVLRTRQLLRDAFVELLEEMDIEKISVNKLAERATINRVTFYLHYKDIPDMLEKMADDMISDIHLVLDRSAIKSESPEVINTTMLVKLLEHIADHSKFYKVILASQRTTIFTERLLRMLTGLISEGIDQRGSHSYVAKANIQKDIAIWYSSAALIGTIVSWLRADLPYSPVFLAKQFLLLRTLSEQKE